MIFFQLYFQWCLLYREFRTIKFAGGDRPCLSYVTMLEEYRIVEYFLEQPGIDVNMKGKEGYTPLHCASDYDCSEVVKVLLDNDKVDVNLQDNHGMTALHWASHEGHLDVVEALLGHSKIDVNIQNNTGDTALDHEIGKVASRLHNCSNNT